MSNVIIKFNEAAALHAGLPKDLVNTIRHLVASVGSQLGQTTLPEVTTNQEWVQIDGAFTATPIKPDGSADDAFGSSPDMGADRGIDQDQAYAQLSAELAELRKYVHSLELAYALDPVAMGVDWTRPGRIGSSTANTGTFTTLSATGQITSTLATGTAPLVVASATQVANLNASQLAGATWAEPGTIGSTTRNTGAFTTLFANIGSPPEAGSQCVLANTDSTEYAFPTLWAGHGTQKDVVIYNGAGTGVSGAASVMFLTTKNSATGRSINAAGTINASGADYAEYMTKAADCGVVAKGQIVGITADGKLTDKWANAIAFAVKSTDPSYVGGDSWSLQIGERPVMTPQEDGEADDEYLAREDAFLVDLLTYETDLESARRDVDRIAFSGRVPCNVMGATPGHYIVPVQDGAGIAGASIASPTVAQYMAAVGRVIAIEPDGRAQIVVKIG